MDIIRSQWVLVLLLEPAKTIAREPDVLTTAPTKIVFVTPRVPAMFMLNEHDVLRARYVETALVLALRKGHG
ncbi:MAG: hypothetical protein AMJ94_11710 [Deltaproteobacteria bacterium SM23_61]|nr:MAG: hypothetical protein AMJ94_11710 [Deltaproteobacteria bacterium SM23_61]